MKLAARIDHALMARKQAEQEQLDAEFERKQAEDAAKREEEARRKTEEAEELARLRVDTEAQKQRVQNLETEKKGLQRQRDDAVTAEATANAALNFAQNQLREASEALATLQQLNIDLQQSSRQPPANAGHAGGDDSQVRELQQRLNDANAQARRTLAEKDRQLEQFVEKVRELEGIKTALQNQVTVANNLTTDLRNEITGLKAQLEGAAGGSSANAQNSDDHEPAGDVRELTEQLAQAKNCIATLEEENKKLKGIAASNVRLRDEVQNLTNELAKQRNDSAAPAAGAAAALDTRQALQKQQEDNAALRNQITELNETIEQLKQNGDEKATEAQQAQTELGAVRTELAKANAASQKATEEAASLKAELDTVNAALRNQITELKGLIEQLNQNADEKATEAQQAQTELGAVRTELAKANAASQKATEEAASLKAELDTVKQQLVDAKNAAAGAENAELRLLRAQNKQLRDSHEQQDQELIAAREELALTKARVKAATESIQQLQDNLAGLESNIADPFKTWCADVLDEIQTHSQANHELVVTERNDALMEFVRTFLARRCPNSGVADGTTAEKLITFIIATYGTTDVSRSQTPVLQGEGAAGNGGEGAAVIGGEGAAVIGGEGAAVIEGEGIQQSNPEPTVQILGGDDIDPDPEVFADIFGSV